MFMIVVKLVLINRVIWLGLNDELLENRYIVVFIISISEIIGINVFSKLGCLIFCWDVMIIFYIIDW